MRLFISHAATDLEVAEEIKLRLEELPGIRCDLLALDIAPGDDWEQRIRRAARDCDAIACLVTPEYITRPWFYAEWAAFWFQEGKTWYLLMLDTSLDDVFEVMRRRQSAFLDERRSVERLLEALLEGAQPPRGIGLLADEMVRAVAAARIRAARATAEASLARLAIQMRGGEDNVSMELVERLVMADRLREIVAIARDPSSNNNVKKRQLARFLINVGRAEAVAQFDALMDNNAERRTVGIACLERLAQGADEDAHELVLKIYAAVREPQRRNLRDRAAELGLGIEWPDVEPNP